MRVQDEIEPKSAVSKAIAQIRPATFDDYSQIAAVQERNGLSMRPPRDWEELWTANPAYQEWGYQLPIGWVLEAAGGEIVGTISNLPVTYWLDGARMQCAAACSWAVDFEYRRYAMGLLARFMKQGEVDFTISTSVNTRSEVAFRSYGWSPAPSGHWNESEFWVTNRQQFMEIALRVKKIPLARWLKYPASAALITRDRWRRRFFSIQSNAEIRLIEHFDDQFDAFWNDLQRERRDVLLADRSADALAWHQRCRNRLARTWTWTASKRGRLQAYALFDRYDNTDLGLTRVRLVDFQCLDGAEPMMGDILLHMRETCQQQGIHILECAGRWFDWSRCPGLEQPYRRSSPYWCYYYRSGNAGIRKLLGAPARWMPRLFDGDASL